LRQHLSQIGDCHERTGGGEVLSLPGEQLHDDAVDRAGDRPEFERHLGVVQVGLGGVENPRTPMFTFEILKSLSLFLIAGVCEIGGGWLMWQWLRNSKPGWWGLVGALILMLYGVIPTLQAAHFGRTYAVYGGFFIVPIIFYNLVQHLVAGVVDRLLFKKDALPN
jgi:drug/metabolite transporter superfamily protein YnfA